MHLCVPGNRHVAPVYGQTNTGQTMIFMIMALIILAVVMVWVFDVHTVLQIKARTQNAGDAAALATARWQGITLNLIGDLNVLQALAICYNDANAAQITEVQARLCFAGPLIGLLAAQQAAKNNRIYNSPDFTTILAEDANHVLSWYATDTANFPEPYTNAWQEYASMLAGIAQQGIAAAPDNAHYFTDPTENHWLLYRDFYNAVAGRHWCWFYWQPDGLTYLRLFSNFSYWPDLPPPRPASTYNSEIFGLNLIPFTLMLPNGINDVENMNSIRLERGISPLIISNEIASVAFTWYGYAWGAWSALAPSNNFPITPLQVKSEYDYAGADAVIRVEAQPDPRLPAVFPGMQPFLTRSSSSAMRLTQSNTSINATTWIAAAKPFGYLMSADGIPIRPDSYTMVLPAFHHVRLIPVDSASGANSGAYDWDWRRHTHEHLPIYVQSGQLEADCWYCQQLQSWETPSFRDQGLYVLSDTNYCRRASHGGGGGGGGGSAGTSRGH